jgi:V/A-type H+/Na+-transporting ATPase subunit A
METIKATNTSANGDIGEIVSINGPVIKVVGFQNQAIGDMVQVGSELTLIGEIIKIDEKGTICQCFEDTTGLELNDKVKDLHYPLSMELGPGILNMIFDGIQRPLEKIAEITGNFISRGIQIPS